MEKLQSVTPEYLFEYRLSRAFLARMQKVQTWPSWIPVNE